MPRNASTGTYEDINDSWSPAIAGTPIDPDDWNDQYADFTETFGTNSLDRTGKGAMLADLDHGAFASLYGEIATPSNPSANVLKLYAKDVGAITKLAILDSAGTETILSGATGTVTSVSGTTNRITVATGTTTPVIDISASYVGQSSITTLGTIGTGVWNGTAIDAAHGGTGQTTYAVGDILYASASTTLSKLADVATGNALISGGLTTAPAWGKIGLTTHISGTLGAANGGTGIANNAASTITISGNFNTTFVVGAATTLTLPSTDSTMATTATSQTFTNKTYDTAGSGNSFLINGVAVTANTGTGAVARATSPTFITSLTSPLVIGGTGAGSSLSLESTSGSGTTDFINFLVASQAEAARFDTGGHFLIGQTSSQTLSTRQPAFQISKLDGGVAAFSLNQFSSDTLGAGYNYTKSRNASIGSHTIVQSGDQLGNILFYGSNGTSFDLAALIQVSVDGTPGASNDMPSRIVFYTCPDGSASVSECVRFDNAANILLGYNGTTGVLATGATNRMPAMPSCAGAKTGTPTTYTGMCPFIYDTTNNKIWIYNTPSAAWKSVALA